MKNKSRFVVVVVILAVILSGCGGVSESDYKKLEERVSELEKRLEEVEGTTSAVEPTGMPSNTPTEEARKEGVYDLSDRTPMQIVYEIESFLKVQMGGKDIDTARRDISLRFRPKTSEGNKDAAGIAIRCEEWHKDYLLSIVYSLKMRESGGSVIDKVNVASIVFVIFEQNRAETIFRELENKYFSGAIQKKTEQYWETNGYNGSYLRMSRQSDRYSINIKLVFD